MGAMPGRVGGKARKKLCASVTSISLVVFKPTSNIVLGVEIERALRELVVAKGIDPRRMGISQMLGKLQGLGVSPASLRQMHGVVQSMLEASHGVDVDSDAAKRAVEIGTAFLADLRTINADD